MKQWISVNDLGWSSDVVPSLRRARPLATPRRVWLNVLGVDRTTVARWEAGFTEPQPWLRPKIAEVFGLSLCEFAQLLRDVEATGHTVEISASPDDTRTLLNELAVTVSVSDDVWEELMSWLSRRMVIKHGAATVLPVLGLGSAAPIGTPSYSVEEPSILVALSGVSWAIPLYEAVLSPTDAAHRVASELESNSGSHLVSLANLRRASANMMQASFSSDYAQLAQSLPDLIGQIELANIHARDADRLHVQRLLSDVYATCGWTLIKVDSPAAAWVAAQRAIQFAEQADDMLVVLPLRVALLRCICERGASKKPVIRFFSPRPILIPYACQKEVPSYVCAALHCSALLPPWLAEVIAVRHIQR